MEDPNPKFRLYHLAQQLIRRQLKPNDIVVTHQKWEVGIQATVILACAEDREASGDLCPTVSEAEESAFRQAVLIYEDDLMQAIAKLPPAPLQLPSMPTPKASSQKRPGGEVVPPPKRPKATSACQDESEPSMPADVPPKEPEDSGPDELALLMARPKSKPQPNGASLPADTADVTGTSKQDSPLQPGALSTTSISIAQAPVGEQTNKDLAKQELMGLCGKIKRGIMQKGDVSYDSQLVVGGYFQATVTVRCLDGDWKDAVFVGEVCRDKSMAEHSAAAVAVAELRKDDAMMARATAKKAWEKKAAKNSSGRKPPFVLPRKWY